MYWKTIRHASVAMLALVAMGAAHAGPIDPMLIGGVNNIEDRSGELVYSCDPRAAAGSQCTLKTVGDLIRITPDPVTGVFDIFVGVLDFENVNGVAIGDDRQLTGIFALKFDGTVFNGLSNIVVQTPVGADIFEEIFGYDLTTAPSDKGTADDVIAVIHQHDDRVTQGELSGGTFASAEASAQLGDLAAILGIVASDDFFESLPINPNAGIVGGGAAGSTDQLFNFAFALSFQYYGFSGDYAEDKVSVTRLSDFSLVTADIVGSGSHTKPAGQALAANQFHNGNDIQAEFFRVPEPATLGLIALSLLAAGAVTRRRSTV